MAHEEFGGGLDVVRWKAEMVEFQAVSPVVKTTEYGAKTAPSTRFPAA
jgi:hypothetical protein